MFYAICMFGAIPFIIVCNPGVGVGGAAVLFAFTGLLVLIMNDSDRIVK